MIERQLTELTGKKVLEVTVGPFSTRIARWCENDKHFYLSIGTTPKTLCIDTSTKFNTAKEAKNIIYIDLRILQIVYYSC
jgi:hypothetical protein